MISVSVIVAVYNVAPYLRQCLDSIVSQTLKDIEIIIIDDASTDESPEILREYESIYPNVRVITHEVNKKLGGARNTGLREAQGEYVAFVDGDDKIDITMYEKLYAKAEETGADLVDCDFYRWYPDSGDKLKPVKSNDVADCGVLDKAKRERLIIDIMWVWTKIFRRELLLRNDLFYAENIYYEDFPIKSLCFLYTDYLGKVSEPLYFYRSDNASVTRFRNDCQKQSDRIEAVVMFLDNYKQRGFYEKFKDAADCVYIHLYYACSIYTVLKRFDNIPKDMLVSAREHMRSNYPAYRENKFFRKGSRSDRICTWLCDLSPELLIGLYRVLRPLHRMVGER